MITFVPLPLYTLLFHVVVLVLVVAVALECYSRSIFTPVTRSVNSVVGGLVALLLVLYMGLRPVTPYYFGDTINYANSFHNLAAGISTLGEGGSEWAFDGAMRWFAAHSDVSMFFLFCAAIYVGALWWAMVRIFGSDYLVPLVVALSMFTFWSYGVNGIRNGMASSLVILAISFRRNIPVAVALTLVAVGIHRSMMLTAAAAVAALVVRSPRLWLWVWVGSIGASLVAGGAFSNLLVSLGLVDDGRFASYVTTAAGDIFSSTGFRWDFLLFSAIPVGVGWYFIFRRGYADRFYIWLFDIYLLTNAFWVMVIRASYSNRFAQISWFVMPLVLIYPFLMKRFWSDQPVRTGTIFSGRANVIALTKSGAATILSADSA